jgi:hypothetical protein
MGDDIAYSKGVTYRDLPTRNDDNEWTGARQTPYGERFYSPIGNFRHNLSDQGTYFVAHNPINDAATTLLGHADPEIGSAGSVMTKPFIHMRMSSAAGDVRAWLDYIEIEVVTAPTNGAKDNWAAQLDTGATRVTTVGTTFTYINPNMASLEQPGLAVQGGAIVTGAESPLVRQLGHGMTRSGVAIIGDRYCFRFGGEPSSGANVVAAAASRHLINMPPVILGPTDQFILSLYTADDAQTIAGVYKVRCAWWEL